MELARTQGTAKCLSDSHVSCSAVYLRVRLVSVSSRSQKVADAALVTSLLCRNVAQLFGTAPGVLPPFTVLHYDQSRQEAILLCDTQEQAARTQAAAALGPLGGEESTLHVVASSPFLAALTA